MSRLSLEIVRLPLRDKQIAFDGKVGLRLDLMRLSAELVVIDTSNYIPAAMRESRRLRVEGLTAFG